MNDWNFKNKEGFTANQKQTETPLKMEHELNRKMGKKSIEFDENKDLKTAEMTKQSIESTRYSNENPKLLWERENSKLLEKISLQKEINNVIPMTQYTDIYHVQPLSVWNGETSISKESSLQKQSHISDKISSFDHSIEILNRIEQPKIPESVHSCKICHNKRRYSRNGSAYQSFLAVIFIFSTILAFVLWQLSVLFLNRLDNTNFLLESKEISNECIFILTKVYNGFQNAVQNVNVFVK